MDEEKQKKDPNIKNFLKTTRGKVLLGGSSLGGFAILSLLGKTVYIPLNSSTIIPICITVVIIATLIVVNNVLNNKEKTKREFNKLNAQNDQREDENKKKILDDKNIVKVTETIEKQKNKEIKQYEIQRAPELPECQQKKEKLDNFNGFKRIK